MLFNVRQIKPFAWEKNKQITTTTTIMKKIVFNNIVFNNTNHEEKQSNWKKCFWNHRERSYTMIRRKFSIPLSSFHQKADNRTCRLSTMSKISFLSAGKKKSDLRENNVLTHFNVAHSTYSQTTVKRIGSVL